MSVVQRSCCWRPVVEDSEGWHVHKAKRISFHAAAHAQDAPVVIEFKAVNLCCEVLERLLWAWAARRQVFLVINVHNASLRPNGNSVSGGVHGNGCATL